MICQNFQEKRNSKIKKLLLNNIIVFLIMQKVKNFYNMAMI